MSGHCPLDSQLGQLTCKSLRRKVSHHMNEQSYTANLNLHSRGNAAGKLWWVVRILTIVW